MVDPVSPLSFRDIAISTLVSSAIASAIVGLLGRRWLSSVEAKHASKLEALRAEYAIELERYKNELEHSKQFLQAEIDKTFLVTKVHFETEFQALKDVFARLAEVRLQLPNLRPRMRIRRSDETVYTRVAALDKAAVALQEAYNKLVDVSENTSPFYPPAIHAQIGVCEQIIRIELNDIALTGPTEAFTHDWLNEGEQHLNEFIAAYNRVSELIRERISKLAILRS